MSAPWVRVFDCRLAFRLTHNGEAKQLGSWRATVTKLDGKVTVRMSGNGILCFTDEQATNLHELPTQTAADLREIVVDKLRKC